MYTLKNIARRSMALGMALSLLGATAMPAASVFAQSALNPLTERSLLLSSSAPGYIDTDGSGYSVENPNPAAGGNTPATFAPAGSGPNGKKTGETFSFRASSTHAAIKGFSFQYCTTAAGLCQAPGNNNGDARGTWDPGEEEYDDVSTREDNDDAWPNSRSDLDVTGTFAQSAFDGGVGEDEPVEAAAGEFHIKVGGNLIDVTDWTFGTTNKEDDNFAHDINDRLTGKNNFITLTSPTGIEINAGDYIEVKFVPSESTYITNPGSGSFFVKINTYSTDDDEEMMPEEDGFVVDGGVTVANVMTDSIHITTKVLETMAFSVGTQNRDTMVGAHGTCDPINQANNNRLDLGNPSAEYSLETDRGWDVYSYWRLSSNSSGGATVYYSGNTLANTVGDEIAAMETKDVSIPGTEQFGLGFVDPSVLTLGYNGVMEQWDPAFYNPDYDPGDPDAEPTPIPPTGVPGLVQSEPDRYKLPSSFPFITLSSQTIGEDEFDTMTAAQTASTDYKDASGSLFTVGNPNTAGTAQFKFLPSSLMIPEPIAQQDETVISCATAKMRYVGNIAADTPAGVYTTKINYLAAPQY